MAEINFTTDGYNGSTMAYNSKSEDEVLAKEESLRQE